MLKTPTRPVPTLADPEPVVGVEPARRTVRARDALVTIAVCLAVWGTLAAPLLERDAEAGPVGVRRSAALALLRPLASLSDALAFDRAGGAFLRAVGRDPDAPPGGELELPEIDLPEIELPPAPSPPPPAVEPSEGPRGSERPVEGTGGRRDPKDRPDPVAEGIRVPTPGAELRVVVVGDSLAQGLGPALAGWFDPRLTRVIPLGRQSTGLARIDYFDWRLAVRRIEAELRPDLVFVMLGSNDNQAQVDPDGRDVPVGSVEWVLRYRERAEAFLREATSAGTRVVWVGVPIVQDHRRWDFYRRVNDIYRAVAQADPLATFVDAWELFRGRDDGYAAYLRNEHGVLQQMRAGDGIHLTPAGYDHLARAAIRAAADAFGLPQQAVTFRI